MIRLLVADDHPMFVSGLTAVLDAEADMSVVAVAATGEEALRAATEHAYGYALKGAGPDEIVAAVRAVARGEAVFGAGVAAKLLGHFARAASASPFPQLTSGQRQRPRRHHAALARCRRAERRGRRRRGDPGRRPSRWRVHLPVRRAGTGHLLVPLPPGLARAGGSRPFRGPGGAPARIAGDRRRRADAPLRRGAHDQRRRP